MLEIERAVYIAVTIIAVTITGIFLYSAAKVGQWKWELELLKTRFRNSCDKEQQKIKQELADTSNLLRGAIEVYKKPMSYLILDKYCSCQKTRKIMYQRKTYNNGYQYVCNNCNAIRAVGHKE